MMRRGWLQIRWVARSGLRALPLLAGAVCLQVMAASTDPRLDDRQVLCWRGLRLNWSFVEAPGWSKTIGNGDWSRATDVGTIGGTLTVKLEPGGTPVYRLAATFPADRKFTAARLNLPLPIQLREVRLDGRAIVLPRTLGASGYLGGGKCRTIEVPLVDGGTAVITGDFHVSVEDQRKYNAKSENFMINFNLPRVTNDDRATYAAALHLAVRESGGGRAAYDWPKGAPYFTELIRREGAEWVACDFARVTKAGSPLDLSGQFAASSGKPRYFGGNCSWSAAFLSHAETDRLADELVRLGYNIVRAHQHDTQFLPKGATDSTELDPDALDRFDYFVAAMKKRGIAFTTDCYSSRKFLPTDPSLAAHANEFRKMKTLLATTPAAMENWKAFARRFLTHVNPYTGLSLAEDPSLVCLNLVNEDNQNDAEAQHRVHAEQIRYLKEELGVKAPLTSLNMMSGTDYAWRRELFDVIDLHQYFAHPAHEGRRWWMPESLRSQLEPSAPAAIWRANFCQRFYDRPCFLTEYRHVPPNVFRSEAGPIIGAYAALQDLDGLVGYGYLESAAAWTGPVCAVNAFDTASDAFSLFGERISAFLFRRGDVKSAARKCAVVVPEDVRTRKDLPKAFPEAARSMGLLCQMGVAKGQAPDGIEGVPLAEAGERFAAELPTNGVYVSSTGEITLDTNTRQLRVVTPRSEALSWSFGSAAGRFLSAGEVHAPVTVSCHALDGRPLAESKSILVFHLTDSACTGEAYVDQRLRETAKGSTRRAPMLIRRDAVTVRFAATGTRLVALKCDGSEAGEVRPEADGSYRLSTDLYPGAVLAYHLTRP